MYDGKVRKCTLQRHLSNQEEDMVASSVRIHGRCCAATGKTIQSIPLVFFIVFDFMWMGMVLHLLRSKHH